MRRREIVFEELKNGSFICRDGKRGAEFGRAATFNDAMNVAIEWLTLQEYEGEAAVLVKPWRASPFTGPALLQHNFAQGKNLWKA